MSPGLVLVLLTPFMTALIGWFTNWVAIQMLFYPRRPIRVLRWTWQGLVPRRQGQIAAETADLIEREILQRHAILQEIRKVDLSPYLRDAARTLVWKRIAPRLKSFPLIGGAVSDNLLNHLENMAREEIEREAVPLMERVAVDFEGSLNLRRIIEHNIASFDLDRLERVVHTVARREFRAIERLGGVLGFIIGLAQIALFWATGSIDF